MSVVTEKNPQGANAREHQTIQLAIFGATGLIGKQCLEYLKHQNQIDRIVAPTRRPLDQSASLIASLIENPQVNFDALQEETTLFSVDAIICALGTTQKKAGSKEAFRKVDYEYCLQLAELGLAHGAQSFHVVTALGSNPDSLSFYSRVKGDLETKLKTLKYPVLSIFQPSLLLGDRDEHRLGEELGMKASGVFNRLMLGSLSQFKAIDSGVVAKAVANDAINTALRLKNQPENNFSRPIVNIYRHDEIQNLAVKR